MPTLLNASSIALADSHSSEVGRPNFQIIGSGKCGTTALASILAAHPDCCVSSPKEFNFFRDDSSYKQGWDFYRQAFAHYDGQSAVGEAAPYYTCRHDWPGTAQRIHAFNPDTKIIFMVRHPLQRQISAWKMIWAWGVEGRYPDYVDAGWAVKGFDYWMKRERGLEKGVGWSPGRWGACLFDYQLAPYLEQFPQDQILVTFIEDWKAGKAAEVARIMRFIGLDPERQPAQVAEVTHRAEDRTILKSAFLRSMLRRPMVWEMARKLPTGLKRWTKAHLPQAPAVPPPVDLTPETKAEFREYLKADNEAFLTRWGKPLDYWSWD